MPLPIPEDLNNQVELLSARTGRSVQQFYTEATEEHVKDLEDEVLAERAFARYEASSKRTTPASEVWEQLGI